jgi:cell division protein FtsW
MAAEEIKKQQGWDYILLLVTLILTGMGLVMVFSSSSMLAQQRFGDPYFFFRPQAIYALIGLAIMLAVKHIPYQLFTRLAYLFLLGTLAALVLVIIPEIGHRVGGSSRWLRLGGYSFQPSEPAKMTLVIYLAYSLAAKRETIEKFTVGLVPHLLVLGVMVGLVLIEPDLGAAVTMCALAMILFFVAGVRLTHLLTLALLGVPFIFYQIVARPYRMKRIAAFMSPWDDPLGAGYHIIHSFFAFASGGLTGLGPGAGQQKLFFLPEPHTDFIFSVVGEEFGFVGVACVALLFLILVARGISVAMNAYDLEGTYLALGLTMIIGVQAFLNMAVVLGLLPTKGLILPFFSYGGSAMLVNFACMGIILNVAGQNRRVQRA